jgi:hypothetical protein
MYIVYINDNLRAHASIYRISAEGRNVLFAEMRLASNEKASPIKGIVQINVAPSTKAAVASDILVSADFVRNIRTLIKCTSMAYLSIRPTNPSSPA